MPLGRGPRPLPHTSPSPLPRGSKPSYAGRSTDCSRRAGMETPAAGGGEWQPPREPPRSFCCPISPQNREHLEHTVGFTDQECKDVWPGQGGEDDPWIHLSRWENFAREPSWKERRGSWMEPLTILLYNSQEGKEEAASGTDQELPWGRRKSQMRG